MREHVLCCGCRTWCAAACDCTTTSIVPSGHACGLMVCLSHSPRARAAAKRWAAARAAGAAATAGGDKVTVGNLEVVKVIFADAAADHDVCNDIVAPELVGHDHVHLVSGGMGRER